MNMYPSQVSPSRTPGCNEYVHLAGVPSKNTELEGGSNGGGWGVAAEPRWGGVVSVEVVMVATVRGVMVAYGGGVEMERKVMMMVLGWWRRVVASGVVDLIDRLIRKLFGFGRKARRKSFPAAANGGRRWPAGGGAGKVEVMVVAGVLRLSHDGGDGVAVVMVGEMVTWWQQADLWCCNSGVVSVEVVMAATVRRVTVAYGGGVEMERKVMMMVLGWWRRVVGSGAVYLIDRLIRKLFGFGRKARRKSFSAAANGGKRWPADGGAGGEGREGVVCVFLYI
uniref:Uncharacterized protein n=1 Tax=Tanacetum cinerariifolium TaxID=118510 RepID=A0A6L2P589_TANCI|nr:hypothetical protein [Tanacetum cinerariifolium]